MVMERNENKAPLGRNKAPLGRGYVREYGHTRIGGGSRVKGIGGTVGL